MAIVMINTGRLATLWNAADKVNIQFVYGTGNDVSVTRDGEMVTVSIISGTNASIGVLTFQ